MSLQDEKATTTFIESVTRESGSSSRTFKSALIFCVPDSADALCDEARKVLAWEDIDDEADDLKLDETQVRQLDENVKTAKGDYKPFCYNQALMTTDIDFSEEMFLITKETAEA